MDLTTPASQKAEERPITFVLDDESARTSEEMTLLIRPEELTTSFPSRMTVNQTLGGGWADSFGEGLEEGTMAGTTGWRASSDDAGGTERLIKLRQFVYHDWHAKRAAAVVKGDDPALVRLIMVDTLNEYSRVIAPRNFELKRSKSRPLLSQYRFNFVMISQDVTRNSLMTNEGGSWFSNILGTMGSWLDSFTASVNAITTKVKQAYKWIDKTIVQPVKTLVAKTMKLYNSVRDLVTAGVGVIRQVGSVATLATQALTNIFRAASLVANIPNIAKATIMGVVREFTNLFCLIKNAKVVSRYEDYSDIYGASNCSSTAGGRSVSIYSGTNTFEAVNQNISSGLRLTQQASTSLGTLANTDLVTSSLSTSSIVNNLSAINSGLTVTS